MDFKRLGRETEEDAARLVEALAAVAPACITEARDEATGEVRRAVDFEALRDLLGDAAEEEDDGAEMYQFTWPGKRAARRAAGATISDTLRPYPAESEAWETTKNLYIEGDNLTVLKLLQRGYMGKVKMIYIDPPYNTGNDYIYDDNYARSAEEEALEAGLMDDAGVRYRRNPDSRGRFHSDWCSMIYSRLLVARSLLARDGIIFISIDDSEAHNLRKICDEVFGEDNFIINIAWRRTDNQPNIGHAARVKEYIACYARSKADLQLGKLPLSDKAKKEYRYEDERGPFRRAILLHKTRGRKVYPKETKLGNVLTGPWMVSEEEFDRMDANGEIYWTESGDGQPYGKIYLADSKGQIANDFWGIEFGTNQRASLEVEALFKKRIFDFPKPVSLLYNLLSIGTDKDSLILDFFSGSGTTAHAVMQLNAEDGGHRRFILVQLAEKTPEGSAAQQAGYATIPALAQERIRRAGQQIKAGLSAEAAAGFDTGFRLLKLDTENFSDVARTPGKVRQQDLAHYLENIKSGRTALDLLFGAMLRWGLELSLPIATEEAEGVTLYVVNGGVLVACFTAGVTEGVARAMAAHGPARVLFRDGCFSDDTVKINVYELFKQTLGWSEAEAMRNIRVM